MRTHLPLLLAIVIHSAIASIEYVRVPSLRRPPLSEDSFSSHDDRLSTDSRGTGSSAATPNSIIDRTVRKVDERTDLRYEQTSRKDKQRQIMSDLQRGMAELQRELEDIQALLRQDDADFYSSRYSSWISFEEAQQTIKDYYRIVRPVQKLVKDIAKEEAYWVEFKDIMYNILVSLERIIPIGQDLADGSHDRNAPKYFDRGVKTISKALSRLSDLVVQVQDDEDDD